jgi:hypothetical protein
MQPLVENRSIKELEYRLIRLESIVDSIVKIIDRVVDVCLDKKDVLVLSG